MSDAETTPVETGADAPAGMDASVDQHHHEDLVPAWLAALVLVLLLAVVGVSGYLIRDRLGGDSNGGAAASIRELAIRHAQDAVSETPNDVQAHLDLGFAYQENAQYDKALNEYDNVLKIDKRNTAALYNQGVIHRQLGDTRTAEKLFLEVLDISKTHALAAKALGEYYRDKNDPAALIRAVAPAAEARPDMADLQYLLGWAYEKRGDLKGAERFYRDALKYVPDMPEARAALTRVGGK
jgi:tetratricopeptide (TPR) repeat protein